MKDPERPIIEVTQEDRGSGGSLFSLRTTFTLATLALMAWLVWSQPGWRNALMRRLPRQSSESAGANGVARPDPYAETGVGRGRVPESSEALPAFGTYVQIDDLPERIGHVQPEYPELAREAGVEGMVMVQALIGADGRVKDVRVTQSVPMLDDAAVKAVRQWTFRPARFKGVPVAVWVGAPVRFKLR